MRITVQELLPLIRIVFPEQRRWLVRAFVLVGLPLVASTFWEPYATALFERHFGVHVPTEVSTATGWTLIVLALVIALLNEIADRLPKPVVISLEAASDRRAMTALFQEVDTSVIDVFVGYGKVSAAYWPALHHQIGVKACVESSTFHLHDSELHKATLEFSRALTKAWSYGEFFHPTSSPLLHKFDSRPAHVSQQERLEQAHSEFIAAVYETESTLRTLCTATKKKFPDFDFDATNRIAKANYFAYEARAEA
jgi:hypothetical protein